MAVSVKLERNAGANVANPIINIPKYKQTFHLLAHRREAQLAGLQVGLSWHFNWSSGYAMVCALFVFTRFHRAFPTNGVP